MKQLPFPRRIPFVEELGLELWAFGDGQADDERYRSWRHASCSDGRRDDGNIVGKVGWYHDSVSGRNGRGWRPQRDSTRAEIHLHDEPLTQFRSDDACVECLRARQSERLVR